MYYNVISSGSDGNATLIISDDHCILLDFGISKKRVETALAEYGKGFLDIEAFLLTHGHSDHASDIKNAPEEKLYTAQREIPKTRYKNYHLLRPYETFHVGPFAITALPLSHDCKDTIGFVVDDGKEKLCYVTDTGFVPEKNFTYLKDLDYYIFESNHDPKMLYESKRPDYLIKRIISDKGHLSNQDCGYYLSLLIGPKTKEVVLAHLSDECNTPELALTTVKNVLKTQIGYLPEVHIKTASVSSETKGGRG